jgi:hypothetical protein
VELVAHDLKLRYPGFDRSGEKNSKTMMSALTDWVLGHEALFTAEQPPMLALGYHVRYHPAYCARRNYAVHCRSLWRGGHFDRLPSFMEWRTAANLYFEK